MTSILRKIIYFVYGWKFGTVVICSILAIALWSFINKCVSKKVGKIINCMMLAIITIAILFFTVANRSSYSGRAIRLIPFVSFVNAGYGAYQTMWLNAFFFLPFGLSLPFLLPEKLRHKALLTIIIAALFSTCIEATQYYYQLGLCETDDVIMNTLGAALGTISYITANHKKEKSEP